MNRTPDWDVIVVGGGPSGAATATHLARDGWHTLLLDRATFPRDKPCGECFSPPVRGLLSTLGVYENVVAAGAVPFAGACLHFAQRAGLTLEGEYAAEAHQWAKAGGMSLPRHVLDNLLWQNAGRRGVTLLANTSVRGLLRDARGQVCGVRTDRGAFTARLVVGADGTRSRIAREMGVVEPIARLQKIGLVAHYDLRGAVLPPRVQLYIGPNHTVCGIGPGSNGSANVTCDVPESEGRQIAAKGPDAYFDALLATSFPDVAKAVQGGHRVRLRTCGTFGHRTRTSVADGALLVGDAATFIDPFTGEGVYFALRGAEIAFEAIGYALRRNDVTASGLQPYIRARRAELTPKYRLCQLVEWAIHCDPLVRGLGPAFASRPPLMDLLVAATGDLIAPRELWKTPRLWHAVAGRASKKTIDRVHLTQ